MLVMGSDGSDKSDGRYPLNTGEVCGLGEVDGSLEGSGVRADVIRNGHPTPVA